MCQVEVRTGCQLPIPPSTVSEGHGNENTVIFGVLGPRGSSGGVNFSEEEKVTVEACTISSPQEARPFSR